MSVITAYGEKLGETPSIDGDVDVLAPPPVLVAEDQVVVQGEKVHVTMAPPLLRVETTIHEQGHGSPVPFVVEGSRSQIKPKPAPRYYVPQSDIHGGLYVFVSNVRYSPPEGIESVLGDSLPRPPVAKTMCIRTPMIHDKPRRPSFVVNLGDLGLHPSLPKPLLKRIPFSVEGPNRPPIKPKPLPTYRIPEADIHGGVPEEREPETSVIWEHPPVKAPIHDFSQIISL